MAVKKKAAKKKAAKKTVAASAVKKPPTKSEILNHIAGDTELSRKEVTAVLDSLSGLIEKNLKARGPGFFNLPGLLKIKVIKKPASQVIWEVCLPKYSFIYNFNTHMLILADI